MDDQLLLERQSPSWLSSRASSCGAPSCSGGLGFADLLAAAADRLAEWDTGHMSLLCASGLPGAEDLDVSQYLSRLDQWAVHAGKRTEGAHHIFERCPERCKRSEAVFRMMMLVEVIKLDFRCHYNPDRIPDPSTKCLMPFWNSGDLLIHGLLSEDRAGTCNNIPMLVVALARRLGYPVWLVTTPVHVFARWDDGRERFNIEASNAAGMVIHDDEHYRHWPVEMLPAEERSGYYLRSHGPADELALYLMSRAWVLEAHRRYAEALPALVKCCALAPTEPMYACKAARMVGCLLDVLSGQSPGTSRDHCYDRRAFRKLLPDTAQAAMAMFILGHWHEIEGRMPMALDHFREANFLQRANLLLDGKR